MKNGVAKHRMAVAVLLSLLLPGCGTIVSKTNPDGQLPNQSGHPYTGTQVDIAGMKCALQGPAIAKERDKTSYWLSVPAAGAMFVLFTVDLVLSLVADTLLLPVDLMTEPKDRRITLDEPSCVEGRPASTRK